MFVDHLTPSSTSPRRAYRRWGAASATTAIAALLLPISLWQFGLPGVAVVASFLAAMLISLSISARVTAAMFANDRPAAAVLAGSAVRMIVPLGLATAVAIQDGRFVPLSAVLYMVPLYLTMLLAETWCHSRELLRTAGQAAGVISGGGDPRGNRG